VHGQTSFSSLLVVVLLAVLVPVILMQIRWLRVPTVVGEIVAGIVIGQSGLNLIGEDPWLALLSTLGFSYLMFLSGLEIDFGVMLGQDGQIASAMRERLRSPVVLALASFALALGAAFGLALGLLAAGLVRNAVLMALILSTTSLGLVVPTLKERRELGTRYGQELLLAALLADFATMLLVSIYVIFNTSGLTLDMLVVLVLLGAFFTAYRLMLALRRHPPLEARFKQLASATGHIQTRGAFAVGLAFIALAEQLGIEVILGAFLGGALISLLSERKESALREHLDALGYGFFIPIFFVMVGVRFDLAALLSSSQTLLLTPLLIVTAYLIKLVSALIFRLAHDWRHTLGAGMLLSSRLSLIIAVAAIGLDLEAISPAVHSAIILLAIVTCTLSPLLFNRLVPPTAESTPRLVMVVGGDQETFSLAHHLVSQGDPVVLAVPAGVPLPTNPQEGLTRVQLNEVTQEALQAAGGKRARTLVALLVDDVANLRLCQIAKTAFRIRNVVARVNDPANVEAYTAAGAYPVTTAGLQVTVLANLASNPNVFTLLSETGSGREIVELAVTNPALDDVPVHRLHLPGQALMMVVQRDGRFIVPRGETHLALSDVVTVLASPDEADQVRDMFTGGEW
jgi:Kef-type K+ transport system membrane component KefB/Trk K+ transport system NAD-binding subunit